MSTKPARSVCGPRHSVKKGKTPVLSPEEARAMLDTIDAGTTIGRNRPIKAVIDGDLGQMSTSGRSKPKPTRQV